MSPLIKLLVKITLQTRTLRGITKVLDLCRRQNEINLAVVVAYVSQRGFIWKQRCRCIPPRSFNRRVHQYRGKPCQTFERIRREGCRLKLFIHVSRVCDRQPVTLKEGRFSTKQKGKDSTSPLAISFTQTVKDSYSELYTEVLEVQWSIGNVISRRFLSPYPFLEITALI